MCLNHLQMQRYTSSGPSMTSPYPILTQMPPPSSSSRISFHLPIGIHAQYRLKQPMLSLEKTLYLGLMSSIASKDYHTNHLLLWTTISHLQPMEILNPNKEETAKKSCADSHQEFLTKCFYLFGKIKTSLYPYHKKNEDITNKSKPPKHGSRSLQSRTWRS